jgi:hypothetical protein
MTNSLEPGRDGVGDYCRSLARQCQNSGNAVLAIALNDIWISDSLAEVQDGVRTFRVPSNSALKWRIGLVREKLFEFEPDWISLQYVCYGFNKKGLPWGWSRAFGQIYEGFRRRHIMMHELWIGEGKLAPLRHRVIGVIQRRIIRNLFRQVNPDLITTSMSLYRDRLARLRVSAKLLPLFGQIPVVQRNDAQVLSLLRSVGSDLTETAGEALLTGVFFGLVHPDFDFAAFIEWIRELRIQTGRPILLIFAGRSGPEAEKLTNGVKDASLVGVEMITLGEISEEAISQVLQFADFGLSTGNPEYLGKSSAFATMRSHGLPMAVMGGQIDPVFINKFPRVVQFSETDSIGKLLGPERGFENEIQDENQSARRLIALFEAAASATGANPVI